VDLGFVEGPSAPRGLRSRVVATDRLVIVVRPDHPWARRRSPVGPAELAATPLVEREAGSGTGQALTACLGPGTQLAAPALRLSTTTAVREAVRAGAGPAVLSLLAVRENVAASLLAVVPVPGLELGRRLRAVWAGAAQPPAGPARDLMAVAIRLGAPPEPA
jgi:DNA-binding transcriptional LysR family regulator